MKHITIPYNEEIFTGTLLDFYCKDLKMGTLDIETTGLNGSRNKFILGGLLDFSHGMVHQFFAQKRNEERDALEAFIRQASKLDLVVTYNGRHFDLPFIEKRMEAHGIKATLPYNLDLYLILNGHSPIKKLVPNLKQKTVERYMGIAENRADEISGGESVELYNTYERTGDADLERNILLHNSDDVMQLTRLLKVISKCDFHRAMYHLGFPVGPLMIQKIRTEGSFLMFSGIQRTVLPDYKGFTFGDFPAEAFFDSKTATFFMKLPIIRDSGLCIADLEAAGMDPTPFEKYPTYSSGFLVLENRNEKNFMEINHFIKCFIDRFMATVL